MIPYYCTIYLMQFLLQIRMRTRYKTLMILSFGAFLNFMRKKSKLIESAWPLAVAAKIKLSVSRKEKH